MNLQERIDLALEIAGYGYVDGSHHKMWVIDQMVRALTDCPRVTETAIDHKGYPYTYESFGESQAYLDFVGEDWDEGIAP